jgi:WhiB family redox-sensing transcriptional regulator
MGFGRLTGETSDVLEILGIDPDDYDWPDFALCKGMDTNLWYDEYEADEAVAKTVDQMCFSCPVMKQCLMYAVENSEWGVWGGCYLVAGKPEPNKNSHKDKEDWDTVRGTISGRG